MKPKQLIIYAVIAALIYGVYYWFKNRGLADDTAEIAAAKAAEAVTPKAPQNGNTKPDAHRLLFRGIKNAKTEVTELQLILNTKFGEKIIKDGIFGAGTEAAIMRHFCRKSVMLADAYLVPEWKGTPYPVPSGCSNKPTPTQTNAGGSWTPWN